MWVFRSGPEVLETDKILSPYSNVKSFSEKANKNLYNIILDFRRDMYKSNNFRMD